MRVRLRERGCFVCGRAIIAQLECSNARRVDDALGAGGACRLHYHASSFDICSHDVATRRRPKPIVSSYMKDIARAACCKHDRVAIAYVAFNNIDIKTNKICSCAFMPNEGT